MIVTNSLTGGGAERSMNLVVNELTKRGWPVALVPINSGPSDLVIPTCEVFPLERQWQSGILETFRSIVKFNHLVNSWKPDLIVLNCDLPELFGALLISHRKLIAVEHINRPWITRKIMGRVVRRVLKMRNVTWAAVSSHLTIWPRENIPSAVLLNSIVISDSSFKIAKDAARKRDISRLVFIGRLTTQKRPDWFIEICKRTKLPGLMIGDGAMRASMEESVRLKGLHIDFVGQITDPWRSLKEGDLLIVPSEFEGDGLVVIEGLAFGIPMLVADIPDFRRFNFSEKVYCQDQEMFVEKIEKFSGDLRQLIEHPEKIELILSQRTLASVGDSWEKFLNLLKH